MLEDDFTYVLRKALLGNGISSAEAAARAGMTEQAVLSFLSGNFSAASARRLAPVLGLNAEAFASHTDFLPKPLVFPNIHRLDLPFGDGQVNAWLLEAGGERVLFDAGYETDDLLRALTSFSALPNRVCITHGHRDHIGGMKHFLDHGIPVHSAGLPGTILMKPGEAVFCGPLVIRACELSGHYTPALGYHIEGMPSPVFVIGDALFAGSIGGCATPDSYGKALHHLRAALAPLTDTTALLPGHGPSTTVGEERMHNPFL